MNKCERKAPIFRLALTLALALAAGVLCLAPPAAADLSPNLTLPVGPGFQLVVPVPIPPDPIAPVSPLVLVGFFPPDPIIPNVQSLDLTNPLAPVISNTATAGDTFSVFWYMQPATGFVPPNPIVVNYPPDPILPTFSWADASGNVFVATLTLSGNSHSLGLLVDPQPEPPAGFQGFMATFNLFEEGGRPPATLLFSVTENGVPLSFQLVPVPGAIWLFGSGLLGLVGLRRFRKG